MAECIPVTFEAVMEIERLMKIYLAKVNEALITITE